MSPAHLRYLLLEQGVGSAVLNFFLNAAIAWAMFRTATTVPLYGQQSIVADTLGTCFFLPFITGLVVTRIARRHVRAGRVPPLYWTRETTPWLRWLPSATVPRAAVLGVACILLVGVPVVGVLGGLGVAELGRGEFIVFKGAFAAALAAVVTPLLTLWAIVG